jgi:hypothetical protein
MLCDVEVLATQMECFILRLIKLYHYEKKVWTVMVNNSNNINTKNNHHSPQIIEYKNTTTYATDNHGPGLGQVKIWRDYTG